MVFDALYTYILATGQIFMIFLIFDIFCVKLVILCLLQVSNHSVINTVMIIKEHLVWYSKQE